PPQRGDEGAHHHHRDHHAGEPDREHLRHELRDAGAAPAAVLGLRLGAVVDGPGRRGYLLAAQEEQVDVGRHQLTQRPGWGGPLACSRTCAWSDSRSPIGTISYDLATYALSIWLRWQIGKWRTYMPQGM